MKNKRQILLTGWRNAALLALLSCVGAMAQTALRPAGELSHARQATLNGVAAVSGISVFNNSRIKTARQGAAVINLGRSGRIEVGSESELALHLNGAAVGGKLIAGRALLSAPQGVGIAVQTVKGLVSSESGQAAVLTVEQSADITRVVAHRGIAKVVSGTRVERLTEGEELTLNSRTKTGWQRRRLWTVSAVGAGTVAGTVATIGSKASPVAAKTVTATSTTKMTLSAIVNAGVNYTIGQLTQVNRDPEIFFTTNITCRDQDSFFCQRKSNFIP